MSRGRSNKIVGQIGEFLACAEIARRCDCITTPFSGNVPHFDILATNEQCQTIPIQVKTANGGSWQFDATNFIHIEFDEDTQTQSIMGLKSLEHPKLIYIFVWLGHTKDEPDRFFLFTGVELQQIIHHVYASWLNKHNGQRPRNWQSTHCGIVADDLHQHVNRWDIIISRLGDIG